MNTFLRYLLVGAVLCTIAGCSGNGYLPSTAPKLSSLYLQQLVRSAAQSNNVPAGLVSAVLMAESSGNPQAISPAGAEGLMQLMPATAMTCRLSDPFEPVGNVNCGTRYLSYLLTRFHRNTTFAVAAYNAGPGAVDEYRGVPPFPETQIYVQRVLSAYESAGN